MYRFYERIASDGTVKGSAAFIASAEILAEATGVEIQADTQSVRYTMDGSVPTSSSGMLFLTTEGPKYFLMEDFKRIKFTQGSGGAGALNIHYAGGRDI